MNRSLIVTSGKKEIFSCIQNKTTSRINAIKTLSDYYSIFIEETLYFDDGPNYLEIFKMLSNCVAVGNCFPELINMLLIKLNLVLWMVLWNLYLKFLKYF